MKQMQETRRKFAAAKRGARRKLLELRQGLIPDVGDAVSAMELAAKLRQQLASLPANQRRSLRIRLALAVHDLQELDAELQRQFDEVRGELHRINRYRVAMLAYGGSKGKKSRAAPRRRAH